MGERELREKYGGKLAKAINRAIRAEIPGGDAALNRLANLAGKANNTHREPAPGQPTAAEAFEQQKRVVAGMAAQIRAKWKVGAEKKAAAPRPRTARRPPPRRPARPGGPGKRPR